ncbi:MAG: hypothetical protein ACRC9P_02055, partial [Bacteroides sp.]
HVVICKTLRRSVNSVFNRISKLKLSCEIKNKNDIKKPKYKYWSDDDIKKLVEMKKEGYLLEYIANELGRSLGAVKAQWLRIKNNYK